MFYKFYKTALYILYNKASAKEPYIFYKSALYILYKTALYMFYTKEPYIFYKTALYMFYKTALYTLYNRAIHVGHESCVKRARASYFCFWKFQSCFVEDMRLV